MKTKMMLLALMLSACAGGEVGTGDTTTTTTSPPVEGPVFIDVTDILQAESFPVQVRLQVSGSVPTPCHTTAWEVNDDGKTIEVRRWSLAPSDVVCAQVLEPFEVVIPLGSFESATRAVLLNGESAGGFTIGGVYPPALLIGAGWSFGMCLGYCNADLTVEGDRLVLTVRDRGIEEPLFVNSGSLTAAGRSRLVEASASISGEELEEVYGCPDCADGGAAYLVLEREGIVSRHDMEFSRPPAVLADLHGLAMAMIDSLERCTSNDLVEVGDDCEPQEGS